MSHTPGPWLITEDREACAAVVATFKNLPFSVCRVWHTRQGNNFQDIGDANARLIAAAPDLLEALEQLLDGESIWLKDKHIAIDAIKKARGE